MEAWQAPTKPWRRCRASTRSCSALGDLHTHTNLTDGVADLGQMIRAAERKGYEYYAVTDHAPNLVMQRMTDEKMLKQREQLKQLKSRMRLLHGSELNIAPDGSVNWDEGFLAGFDMCVASVQTENPIPKNMMRLFFSPLKALHRLPSAGSPQRNWSQGMGYSQQQRARHRL